MDKYSRLLVYFSSVNGKQNIDEAYPNFVKELSSVFESPVDELCKMIRDDLATILPAILILSVHEDVGIRTSVENTFKTFSDILTKNPSVKSEGWWKEMETGLIAGHISSKLSKMVEQNTEPWPNNWAFVTMLVVHEDYVHSGAINALLKVVETAFKLSKKFDNIMERAYFCWNELIDTFSKNPRAVSNQKLVELLVRPLSTAHLLLKCPKLKLETWLNLTKKIGFSCGTKCKVIIEPFIEHMYLKGNDSLCVKYPTICLSAMTEITDQKKIFKHHALKVISAFPACYQSCKPDDTEHVIHLWTTILDNFPDVDKTNRNEYMLEIFTRFHQVSQSQRSDLDIIKNLMSILVDKSFFNMDNLRVCILSESSLTSIFSDLMKFEDFRNKSFATTVKNLMDNFSGSSTNKTQNNIDLQIWDLLCDVYSMWIKNMNGSQELSSGIDNETISSLLMIPFIYKQWTVGIQKTWYSVLDSIQSTSLASIFLPYFLEKVNSGIRDSYISAALCIEICTYLTNKDKTVFKLILPTLNIASTFLPPKDSKPLLDLLVLLENAVNRVPKAELSKFVNELMVYGNSYEHPYGLRIKTKISKVQRKLFSIKDTDSVKDQDSSIVNDNNESLRSKNVSPILAQSNFLQRLAKAEERKKKKTVSLTSVFGEKLSPNRNTNNCNSGETATVSDQQQKISLPSPGQEKSLVNEEVQLELSVKNSLTPIRASSPSLPPSVAIITPSRAKRTRSVSPDPKSTPTNKMRIKTQALNKTPPPPTYFEDNAQDFVVIPPKPKSVLLTEHQKEMFSKRSDIPALYQDLSQDTQTNSQSLKMVIVRNEVDSKSTLEKSVATKEHPSDCNTIIDESKSKTNVITPADTTNDNKSCENVSVNCTIESVSHQQLCSGGTQKKDMIIEKNNIIENIKVSAVEEASEDIIENTPQSEPAISFNLTPTKQPAPPTPRNLIKKISLMDADDNFDRKSHFIEEDKEREKENIIINSKQHLEKTPIASVKRRSSRKSTCRFSTKKIEETKKSEEAKDIKKNEETKDIKKFEETEEERKTEKSKEVETTDTNNTNKTEEIIDVKNNFKTESINIPKITINTCEENDDSLVLPVNVSSIFPVVKAEKREDLVTEFSKNNSSLTSNGKVNSSEIITNVEIINDNLSKAYESLEQGSIQSDLIDKNLETSLSGSATIENVTNKLKSPEEPICDKKDANLAEVHSEPSNNTNNSMKDEHKHLNRNGTEEKFDNNTANNIPDENPDSQCTDASSWAMVTPDKRGKKKRRSESAIKTNFSPKQLRSKRLSLTKGKETTEISKRKHKKSVSTTDVIEMTPLSMSTPKTCEMSNQSSVVKCEPLPTNEVIVKIETQASALESLPAVTEDNQINSQKKGSKRKNEDEVGLEAVTKKKKSDSPSVEVVSPDSLLVVKTSTMKPRKKKIIKSNVKISHNNLEQWLIKCGKTVVKAPCLIAEKQENEVELKLNEDKSNDDVSISEGKVAVDLPIDSTKESSPPKKIEEIIAEPTSDAVNDSDDMHNCTLMDTDSKSLLCLSSSEDDAAVCSKETGGNEEPDDISIESLQCHETEVPSTSRESDESIGRRRRAYRRNRRVLRREGTPSRDINSSPEDEAFEIRRERQTTPFRGPLGRPGRSAQMVMMATGDDEPPTSPFHTPVRRRNIPPVHMTENWPEGRMEEWIPCVPTPPTHSPSLSILKKRNMDISLPSSSNTKRKRVSFLDPPVSKGLLYAKGSESIGQVRHADIPPGERPIWKSNESEPGEEQRNLMDFESVDGGFVATDGEDELTAIQEFLNSTPDAPWSTIPPELDVKSIAGLENCVKPIEEMLSIILINEEERRLAAEDLSKLNVKMVADFRSISIQDLNKFCSQYFKDKYFLNIIKDYLTRQETDSREEESSEREPKGESVEYKEKDDGKVAEQMADKEVPQLPHEEDTQLLHEEDTQQPLEEDSSQPVQEDSTQPVQENAPQPVQDHSQQPHEELQQPHEEDPQQSYEEDCLREEMEGPTEANNAKEERIKMEVIEETDMAVDNHSPRTDPPTVNVSQTISNNNSRDYLKKYLEEQGNLDNFVEYFLDKHFIEKISGAIPVILAENSPFFEAIARHADYSFIGRLCSAIASQKENKPS